MNVVDKEGVIHDRCPAAGYPHESGAKAWDDGAGGQVEHINLYHGEIIHSIQTTYERNGTLVMSRKHGGAKGNFTMIDFNEPLTCVSGHYGPFCFDPEMAILYRNEEDVEENTCIHVINSLKFSTARNTYGPFGTERGTPFSFQTGTEITGFHGICSSSADSGHLHAIGVYIRCPAKEFIDGPATQVVVKYERT